jgi:ketosteroid isomerase-like protein
VASRHHVVIDIYPKSDADLMLFGTVEYGLKNGRHLESEWAARMTLTEGKISFYQVYLDASPLLVAQGKTIRGDENGELRIE